LDWNVLEAGDRSTFVVLRHVLEAGDRSTFVVLRQ
jgi:hypothetical protein